MNAVILGFVIIALAAGGVIGWLVGSRSAAGAKQTVDNLRLQLDEVVKERDVNREAATKLAALEASQAERERGFEARIAELIEAKEGLSAQFAEISNKLLAEAQETFLKRADDRFRQSEESAGKNLKALLQPVHERLERYETTVQKGEAERRRMLREHRAAGPRCRRLRSGPCRVASRTSSTSSRSRRRAPVPTRTPRCSPSSTTCRSPTRT